MTLTGVSCYPIAASGKSQRNFIETDTSFRRENNKSSQEFISLNFLHKTMDGYPLNNLTSNIRTSLNNSNSSLPGKSEHFQVIALGLSQFSNHVVTPDSEADEDLSPFHGKLVTVLFMTEMKVHFQKCYGDASMVSPNFLWITIDSDNEKGFG